MCNVCNINNSQECGLCVCDCSLYVTGIHFNENSDKPQAVTQEGVEKFDIKNRKFNHGQCSINPKKQHTVSLLLWQDII